MSKIREQVTITEGRPTEYLGLHIECEVGCIYVDQKSAIEKLLAKNGLSDCNAKKTPLTVGQDLDAHEDSPKCDLSAYQSLLGSLMFIAGSSRPDISFATNALSRYNHSATKMHFEALRGVLRYLKGTANYRLCFPRKYEGLSLYGASDASWSVLPDGKGFSGHAVKFLGGLVIWKTSKQGLVALSSCEAECQAATQCVKDLIWLRCLLADMGLSSLVPRTPLVHTDSQSLIGIVNSLAMAPRTKHYRRLINFVKDEVLKYNVGFVHVPGAFLFADALTKSLPGPKLCEHLPQLSIV
jgi:hypothetical protein